jgi:hypothetical protein
MANTRFMVHACILYTHTASAETLYMQICDDKTILTFIVSQKMYTSITSLVKVFLFRQLAVASELYCTQQCM